MSLPAPLTASCLALCRVAHSSAYESGFSPYEEAIVCLNGDAQSASDVCLRGIEIVGDCIPTRARGGGKEGCWERGRDH